jgi:hypothetical protein
MSEGTPEKPKIIVDEDWKSQVQAEKETAKQQHEQPDSSAQSVPLPEASFGHLVTLLATQASAAMGGGAPPDQEEVVVDLGIAQHMIDLLDVLEQKTKGNLTQDESNLLAQLLHSLRMMYVACKRSVDQQPPAGESPIVTE